MPKITVVESVQKGKCSYAEEFIPKGTVMLETKGKKIPLKEIDSLSPKSLAYNCFQIEKHAFICPLNENALNGIFLVNHSCEPNCGIYDKDKLITMRDIHPGEEITLDYVFCDAEFKGMDCEPFEEFDCLCGTPSCRGKITGTDWQKETLQNKFELSYFSGFIQQMIHEQKMQNETKLEVSSKGSFGGFFQPMKKELNTSDVKNESESLNTVKMT